VAQLRAGASVRKVVALVTVQDGWTLQPSPWSSLGFVYEAVLPDYIRDDRGRLRTVLSMARLL
jgi:hypothetical protein